MSTADQSRGSWTLLTGHGHVLVEIARDPEARIRDISAIVGLTALSVQAIVADLEAAGYLTRTRTGRRVVYAVNRASLFRHSAQEDTGSARSSTCSPQATPTDIPGQIATLVAATGALPRRRMARRLVAGGYEAARPLGCRRGTKARYADDPLIVR